MWKPLHSPHVRSPQCYNVETVSFDHHFINEMLDKHKSAWHFRKFILGNCDFFFFKAVLLILVVLWGFFSVRENFKMSFGSLQQMTIVTPSSPSAHSKPLDVWVCLRVADWRPHRCRWAEWSHPLPDGSPLVVLLVKESLSPTWIFHLVAFKWCYYRCWNWQLLAPDL